MTDDLLIFLESQERELTAHGKGGLVVWLLMVDGPMRTAELREAIGLKESGFRDVMDNLSVADVPIYQPRRGWWDIDRTNLSARDRGVPQLE